MALALQQYAALEQYHTGLIDASKLDPNSRLPIIPLLAHVIHIGSYVPPRWRGHELLLARLRELGSSLLDICSQRREREEVQEERIE